MKCIACHERMEPRTGEIELRINGRLFLVENVTYQQCPSCGERVLNPETSQEIFHKVRSKEYSQKHVVLPVVQSQVAMTAGHIGRYVKQSALFEEHGKFGEQEPAEGNMLEWRVFEDRDLG